MGQRILVLIFTLTALFATPLVHALGLGDISLQSGLNQPLKAEIKLLQVRDLTKNEILVGLGTPQDFERIGVDRPYFLTDIKFEVDLESVTGPVIHVSSRKPVREPYLNFIIQAQWPSGKLLREYTLLLDLPVFSDSVAAPVQSVTSFSGQPTQQPTYQAPAQPKTTTAAKDRYNPRSSFTPDGAPASNQRSSSSSSSSSQAGSSAPPRLAGTDEYSVRAGDTLWEISAAVRPDRGVSIQQTMLAIQRLNPDAFINNNINLLKKGQILRIPDREDIAQTSRQAAIQEVAIQNNAWSGGSSDSYTSSDVQLEGSSTYSSRNATSTTREGRLRLASPEDSQDSYEGRGSGSGESSKEALENELAITLETLDKTHKENSDLRTKIDSLEEQIDTAERLVEVSSEELRALELSAQKNAEDRATAETETPAESGEEQATAEGETSEAETASTETEESKPVEEAKPRPTVQPPVYEKTIVDHILDNIYYIGVGLLVLVIVAFLFIRSRAGDGFDDEDFLTEGAYDEPKSEFDVESALEEEEGMDLFDEETPEEEPEEEEHISEAQTEDVVAEADIYIAYGKYDQAEEILLKSLEKDPDNKDARLKLVEVYASQQDGDKFDHHFAILHELGDDDLITRAEQLRSGIDGLGVFDSAAHTGIEDETTMVRASDEGTDDDGSMDFSLDIDSTASAAEADSDEEFALDLDGDAGSDDFSLDLDTDDTATSDADEFTLDVEGGSDDLDFDLGEFDLETGEDDVSDSDDDFSLDLDDGDVAADDDGGIDFDLGEDLDDLAVDLDSGENEDKGDDLIEDDLEEDLEPIEFVLGDGDTEVGSTPKVTDEEMGDLDFELDSDSSADDLDLDGDFDLDLGAEDIVEEIEEVEDFDLELSDEAIEDLDEVPDLSLDDVSDDDLEPILGTGSEDLTLISPAITDVDLAEKDELNLEGDLDLSALDQELDALTGSGDTGELDDLEIDLEPADDSPTFSAPEVEEPDFDLGQDEEPPAPAAPEMDEPIVDFDSFDEADSSPSDGGAEKTETDMGEDTMFDQAVNEVPQSDMDFDLPEIDPEAVDDDTDLGFLSDSDETATKLDLARAYIDMGDAEGARDIIGEIIKEGNEQQRHEAEALLKKLS